MKICKIYIKSLEQFQSVELDFTHPVTGDPLEKICIIGSNGTGKSKILRMINGLLNSVLFNLEDPFTPLVLLSGERESKIIYEINHKNEKYLVLYFDHKVEIFNLTQASKSRKSQIIDDVLNLVSSGDIGKIADYSSLTGGTRNKDFLQSFLPGKSSDDLVIYSPDESGVNGYLFADVPDTNVNEALALFKEFPVFVEVSPDTISDFWKLLVYNLKKRDDEREKYERAQENINKTKALLIKEFDQISPKILDDLSKIWSGILNKAGLEFDVQGANNPIQLTDNLKAYIRLQSSKKIIPYSNLSTGIRNFIFRVGHIYSLYFNRTVDRGFLLVDEPENGFFPDFLFDLMSIYQQITVDKRGINNTQLFFATHNPIVAAQFQPYERIILDWNEDYSILAKKGNSPIGDDPNDVLSKDFELKDLMGIEGRKKWEEYQNLKKKLIREDDKSKKEELINKINQIGTLYNF